MKAEEKSIAKLLILVTMGSFAVSYFSASSLKITSEQSKIIQVASTK